MNHSHQGGCCGGSSAATIDPAVEALIRGQIRDNPVLLYMKGTPQFPVCGFSARAVQILDHYGVAYASVNILEHPEIRSTLPKLMNWPTFPQLYVDGELIGGSDILMEMHEAGELESVLHKK
jgi:monothiol glutaredoxin